MSLSITKKPLLPVITITKDDNTTYTYNPHTSNFDFRLRSLQVTPAYDHVGGKFTLKIVSSDASNTNMNTFLTNISAGNELIISLGKTSSVTTIFRGIIERIDIDESVKDLMEVTLSGPDWGSYLLKSKLINRFWIQETTDGVTLDPTDDKVLVSQIISDLVNDTSSTPTSEYSAVDMGVVYSSSNITVPEIRLPQFEANYEYLDDKLTEIDNIVGTTHYIDSSKNLIVKDPTSSSAFSGILLSDDYTNAVTISWDQTKLGLIAPGSTYTQTLENHKRRIYGLGGDNILLDQKQQTDSTSTKVHDRWLAIKFKPVYRVCHSIGIKISKVGSPTIGPTIELIEDNNGEPTGSVLRDTLRKDKDAITSTAAFTYFDINETLNTEKFYWIILAMVGDVSNTYQWHRDGSSSWTNAYSTSYPTWTVQTSSYGFCFEQRTSTPVLAVYSDNAAATAKHFVEHVIKQPDITDLRQMTNLIVSQASRLFKQKEIFKSTIFAPDTLLQTGQTVHILKSGSGYQVNASFTISNVEYIFEADDIGVTGQMYYNIEAFRYTEY
jgi:hypothetical protein